MKNNSTTVWIIIIAILAIGAYLYSAHGVPTTAVDTGWYLRLFDANGIEIPVPQNFMITPSSPGFAIWTTEFPIVCPPAACPAGTSCWNSMCVIKNVSLMSLGFNVVSTSSDVTYTSLNVQTATPAEWNTALNKTARTLFPLASTVFTSAIFAIPSTWEDTAQIFSVTVSGKNNYNGAIETNTKSITYRFYPNPAGGFTVTISNPFA